MRQRSRAAGQFRRLAVPRVLQLLEAMGAFEAQGLQPTDGRTLAARRHLAGSWCSNHLKRDPKSDISRHIRYAGSWAQQEKRDPLSAWQGQDVRPLLTGGQRASALTDLLLLHSAAGCMVS